MGAALWADLDIPNRYILRGKRLLTLNENAVALLTEEHNQHPSSSSSKYSVRSTIT